MRIKRPDVLLAIVAAGCVATFVGLPTHAQPLDTDSVLVDLRQGTDSSVTIAAADTLVVEIQGQLWGLPRTGGGATALSPTDEEARHPHGSRDGRFVVYQRLIEGQWDIWLLNLLTGERRALTNSSADEREPYFKPDGNAIVFARNEGDGFDIWQLDLASQRSERLTNEPGDARYPSFADNGAMSYVETGSVFARLHLKNATTDRVIYETRGHIAAPSWRPDGAVLLFQESNASESWLNMLILADVPIVRAATRREDVFASRPTWLNERDYIYAADGQIWRRELGGQTRSPIHLFATYAIAPASRPTVPIQTTASSTIARGIAGFSQTADQRITVFSALGEIWLSSDNTLRQLTDDRYMNTDPVIDPAGQTVVYVSSRDGHSALFRLPVSGGRPEPLTSGNAHSFAPAFDPTGTRLAFLTTESTFTSGPARLNVYYFDDGTTVRSQVDSLRIVAEIHWLADNATANLEVYETLDNGRLQRLHFDAALREVGRFNDQILPPAPVFPDEAARPSWQFANRDAADTHFVIQAGRLFDGFRAGYQRHVDIHIQANRITAVVGRNVLPLPDLVFDARDATVMPGFIDAHSHATDLGSDLIGSAWLAHGVTTVREVGNNPTRSIARAETWASGRLAGPRLIVSSAGDGHAITSTVAAQSAARLPIIDDPFLAAAGTTANFIAMQGSGNDPPARTLLNQLIRRAAVRATDELPMRRYSQTGVIYQDVVSLIAASREFEVTSLGIYSAGQLTQRQQMVQRILRSGSSLAIGSEAPVSPVGLGFHRELALLAAAGIPNDQILRTATSGGALALGVDADLGTIEAGKLADLIVIAGDPLNDITDSEQIIATILDGRWIMPEALSQDRRVLTPVR